jgi:hypothetical protein
MLSYSVRLPLTVQKIVAWLPWPERQGDLHRLGELQAVGLEGKDLGEGLVARRRGFVHLLEGDLDGFSEGVRRDLERRLAELDRPSFGVELLRHLAGSAGLRVTRDEKQKRGPGQDRQGHP